MLYKLVQILFIIIQLSLYSSFLCGQRTIEIPLHVDRWVDAQGNLYLQTTYSIEKLNPDGKNIAGWIAPGGMSISSFDASNNHKILVFFKEFNQIVFLNQSLVEMSPMIDLNISNTEEITAICQASNGDLWLADRLQNLILHVSGNFSIRHSFSFRPYGESSQISKMYEINQRLYVLIADKWLVFDLFGQPVTQIVQEGMTRTQISFPKTWYVEGNNLMEFDIRTHTSQSIFALPVPAIAAYRYGNRTYFIENSRLTIIP